MVELFDPKEGVSEWYAVLNWEYLPDMGACHPFAAAGEKEAFQQRYVVTKELKRFCGTILEKLQTQRVGQPVVVLEGEPGTGKTTLLYALISHLTNNAKLSSLYTFYACHANCINNTDWQHEILYHVKQALKQHFVSCSNKTTFDKICADHSDNNDGLGIQINRLKTYMVEEKHRHEFNKTMVFALDNVDTVDNSERVIEAFELVNRSIEPAIIKKWFVVRPETVGKYSSSQRNRLESFVSDHLTMPKVSLFDVAAKRISDTTGNSSFNKTNPFSKELCDEIILPFCKDNLRNGLSVLEAVLRDIDPKGFADKKADEKVIQNYIRKNVVPTLFTKHYLKNLHDISYSAKSLDTPMAYDLLCLCKFSSERKVLLAMLYEATDRRNIQLKYQITGRENKYFIFDHEFDRLLNKLTEDGLIVWDKRNPDLVYLTSLGKAHIDVSTQKYYAEICLNLGENLRSDTYWNAAMVDVSHASVARGFSTSPLI